MVCGDEGDDFVAWNIGKKCHRISKFSPQGMVDDTEKNMKSRLDIWITLKQAEHDRKHQKRWHKSQTSLAHAEVCGYPMYKDSTTKEPFVLELYRARGAAATCRPAVSLRFPCTSNVSDCVALCYIVLLSVLLSEGTVATCSN